MTLVVDAATATDKSTAPDVVVTVTDPSAEATEEIPPPLTQERTDPSVPKTFPEFPV